MTPNEIYPMTFTPVLRDYIWGGRRLETLFGRELPPGIVAESWEISGHPSGSTPAANGPWAGHLLPEILDTLGERLAGTRARWALDRGRFPLLIKLLDANQDLSLQVHPGDAYALAHENDLGKAEMWYVLHAEPEADLILGLEPDVTAKRLLEALATGDTEAVLRSLPVKAGQAVDVPAGTLHALRAGLVVTEIQQNSDATYRVHDWGRVGADGKPRPLHLDRAMAVTDFGRIPPGIVLPTPLYDLEGVRAYELVRNDYFVVEEVIFRPGASYIGWCEGASLEIWGCMRGKIRVEWTGDPLELPAVRYTLLPAVLGQYSVTATEDSVCLRVYLP
jgi:mannose-6-phosphate isomerase